MIYKIMSFFLYPNRSIHRYVTTKKIVETSKITVVGSNKANNLIKFFSRNAKQCKSVSSPSFVFYTHEITNPGRLITRGMINVP
jgi:hypothetical protein